MRKKVKRRMLRRRRLAVLLLLFLRVIGEIVRIGGDVPVVQKLTEDVSKLILLLLLLLLMLKLRMAVMRLQCGMEWRMGLSSLSYIN